MFRTQLSSLLIRWTKVADDAGDHHDSGKENQSLGGVAASSPAAAADAAGASAEETAALVAAGLKLVKTVCTKAENNKGQ